MIDVRWCYLGSTDYDVAMKLMETLRGEVAADPSMSYLLLLQHPPVITQGYGEKRDDGLKISREELARKGIPVVASDRGGKTTFHGPGQLVGYTIFHLEHMGLKLKQFVNILEEALIQLLDSYGLPADRKTGEPGVWIENGKVAFLGLRVRDNVATHGFALNVNNELQPYNDILACGLDASQITSMRQIAGRDFSMFDVYWRLVLFLGDLLNANFEEVYLDELDWLP